MTERKAHSRRSSYREVSTAYSDAARGSSGVRLRRGDRSPRPPSACRSSSMVAFDYPPVIQTLGRESPPIPAECWVRSRFPAPCPPASSRSRKGSRGPGTSHHRYSALRPFGLGGLPFPGSSRGCRACWGIAGVAGLRLADQAFETRFGSVRGQSCSLGPDGHLDSFAGGASAGWPGRSPRCKGEPGTNPVLRAPIRLMMSEKCIVKTTCTRIATILLHDHCPQLFAIAADEPFSCHTYAA